MPVRTWRDLYALIVVVALIVASFVASQVQTSNNAAATQELKQQAIRRDEFNARMDAVDQRLARIERKIDAETMERRLR